MARTPTQKVHIVSDNQENIDLLVTSLRGEYPEISYTLSAVPQDESGENSYIAIVLLDITESREQQRAYCLQLRKNRRTAESSVIVLSSRNSDADILAAFDVGAVDYIPKPYKLTILKARVKARLKLLQARKMADSANMAKSRLLANMSHDIRTPMAGIIGMTRLALETNLDHNQQKLLGNIRYSAETLINLLNDILDFSKNEAGQMSLHHETFSLPVMLDHFLDNLKFLAAEKQLILKNGSDYSTIPIFIKADELRLRQILTNLIGNAIKFTENGHVTLTVKEQSREHDTITLLFSITDTGIGIPPEKQKTIFNTYSQAEASTYGEYGGSGLGLTICQQLVELMDGTIRVKSKPGKGSTFSFTVKVLSGQQPLIPTKDVKKVKKPENLTILLVEDNKFNQYIATAILEKDSHNVKIADNGLQALKMLAETDFDFILMDLQMPVLDGLAATVIIRACENDAYTGQDIDTELIVQIVSRLQGKHIPIVAMTANAMDEDRQKSLSAGMDYYLTKPFIPADVQKAIRKLV